MKLFIIFLLIFNSSLAEELDKKAAGLFAKGHYKEAIKSYTKLAEQSSGIQKSGYLKQLAKAYYRDQEQVKAFQTFLEALKGINEDLPTPELSADEKLFYDEALQIYLDPKERDPEAVSMKLRDLYAGVLRLHPQYHYLGYLVAIAYANLLEFEEFFDVFYQSYIHIPKHFLAYKTQGILHIKLFERMRTPEEKEIQRIAILDFLEKAKAHYTKDPSLYRMQIAFSPENIKPQVLGKNLNEMLQANLMIPRSDLSFYFDLLFAYGKIDVAKAFLEKARQWYHYSRTLDAAEEMIREKGTLPIKHVGQRS